MVLKDIDKISDLVTGAKSSIKDLPPPKKVAEKLAKDSVLLIHEWYKQFGAGYKQLVLAHQYLEKVKGVNID